MSITGMTFSEFCRQMQDNEREDKIARRKLLKLRRKLLRESFAAPAIEAASPTDEARVSPRTQKHMGEDE